MTKVALKLCRSVMTQTCSFTEAAQLNWNVLRGRGGPVFSTVSKYPDFVCFLSLQLGWNGSHLHNSEQDPWSCRLTQPQQPPSCLSRRSLHKTQAVSLRSCIRLHLHHTSVLWLMSVANPQRLVVRVRIVKRKKESTDVKWMLNIYGIPKELEWEVFSKGDFFRMWFTVSSISREKTHTEIQRFMWTHSERPRGSSNTWCFCCCWSLVHKKRGRIAEYLQAVISLFTSEAGFWAWSTWTVTDPHSPLQLFGRTMHHRRSLPPFSLQPESCSSISLHALSLCLFSQIVTKGRGRRELYLFTTWWHHL